MCRSFDWSHMATLFIQSSGRAVYTLIYSKPPIKIKTRSKNLQPEFIPRKTCVITCSQTFVTPENLQEKQKVYKGVQDQNLASSLLYLREYLPISCFCPGYCISCVCIWGYIQGRGPHSSHFLLFNMILISMSTIMNGDGNYVCVLFRIFISKNKKHRKLQFYQHKIFEHNQKLEVTTT